MTDHPIRVVARNYDLLMPLVIGDVVAEGIELEFDRSTSIGAFAEDESFQAGEMSFSGYLRRLDAGQTDIVGLPVFLMRGFRQHCFFTLRDSGLSTLGDLQAKRIGTNGWPDSGNTWSRALLRRAGVNIEEIEWVVGPIDGTTDEQFGHKTTSGTLPAHAQPAPAGMPLVDLLAAGEIDAMMVPWPPRSFYEANSPVVRVLTDYRGEEEQYARDVGYYPAHHVLGVRASLIEADPWIAASLFDAFDAAQKLAESHRWSLADATPWLLADLERTVDILGPNWQAHGIQPNRAMIDAFARELQAQGIIGTRFQPDEVFARFSALTAAKPDA